MQFNFFDVLWINGILIRIVMNVKGKCDFNFRVVTLIDNSTVRHGWLFVV